MATASAWATEFRPRRLPQGVTHQSSMGGAPACAGPGPSSHARARARSVDAARHDDRLCEAFLAHHAELLGFVKRSLPTSLVADAALQERFARARRAAAGRGPRRGFRRRWLFAIQRQVILDFIDRYYWSAQTSNPGDRLAPAWTRRQVESPSMQRPPKYGPAMTELHFRDLTGREVAVVFRAPEDVVRGRASCALRLVRLALEHAGWEGSVTGA